MNAIFKGLCVCVCVCVGGGAGWYGNGPLSWGNPRVHIISHFNLITFTSVGEVTRSSRQVIQKNIHYKFFLTQFYMLSRSGLENPSTYPKSGWYTPQICTSPRLLLLWQLVLYGRIGREKYWQPSRPRTHANNASIVKICSRLVWAKCSNMLSS